MGCPSSGELLGEASTLKELISQVGDPKDTEILVTYIVKNKNKKE